MTRLIADLLRARVRTGGAAPLVTYYDLRSGERTELSATSFLNWVDKASNLLVEEHQLSSGAVVDLELARQAPGHWLTLAVTAAAWQIGATVRVGPPADPPADVVVLGPDWHEQDLQRGEAVLACALHPLGLGFTRPLPAQVGDFALEVRGQPDVHQPLPLGGDELAWTDGQRRLSQRDLVSLELGDLGARRRLVTASDPWSGTRDGLLLPLRTGGSVVLVVGDDPDALARISADERVLDLSGQND